MNRTVKVIQPTIVVVEEKHGNRYFIANTQQELFDISLKLVKERFEAGYFGEKTSLPLAPEYTRAEAEALKPGIRSAVLKTITKWENDVLEIKNDNEMFERAERAIAKKDGKEALMILADRSDYQYENVTLEIPEDV